MAELFCEGCDTVVGQYCKDAPERRREQMVGQHFYKFSKTQLKDARSGEVVEPVFAVVNEETTPGTPKPRRSGLAPTNTSSPLPRPRTAAALKSSPPQVNGYAVRDQQDGASESPRVNGGAGENQGGLMNRLLELERLVRAGSVVTTAAPPRAETMHPAPTAQEGYGYSRAGVSDQIIEDQKKQIESMTTQMNTLRATIDDLRGVIQDLRAEKARQQSSSLQENAVLNHFEEMIRSVRDSQHTNDEADGLRAENQRLKDRLSTIAGAMGVPSEHSPQNDRSDQQPERDSSLGKRKRDHGPPSRMGFRRGDYNPNEQGYMHNGNDGLHPLTPESMQEMAAARRPTPAGRPPPPNQPYPPQNQPYVHHLQFGFPDPNLRPYGSEAPSSQYYPPQQVYHQAPPPPMFPGNGHNYHPPMGPRPGSRMASRSPQQGPPESVRGNRSGDRNGRRSSGHNVEFSDDEIATANASDAPLSIPRPRPLPPPSLPPYQQNYAPSNPPPRGMSEARPFPPYQTPTVSRKHVPRSLTCTSLRQPATGYGLNNALHFTPDLVEQRIHKKKGPSKLASATTPAAGKEESVSDSGIEIERPGTARPQGEPEEIPIDPALEALEVKELSDGEDSLAGAQSDAGKGPRGRVQVDLVDDEDEDEEDGPYRPGRNSAKKTATQRKNAKGRSSRKSLLDKDIEEAEALLEGSA